jgi:hypothetical protein
MSLGSPSPPPSPTPTLPIQVPVIYSHYVTTLSTSHQSRGTNSTIRCEVRLWIPNTLFIVPDSLPLHVDSKTARHWALKKDSYTNIGPVWRGSGWRANAISQQNMGVIGVTVSYHHLKVSTFYIHRQNTCNLNTNEGAYKRTHMPAYSHTCLSPSDKMHTTNKQTKQTNNKPWKVEYAKRHESKIINSQTRFLSGRNIKVLKFSCSN